MANPRAPDSGTTAVVERACKPLLAGLRKSDIVLGTEYHWADKVCPVAEDWSCLAVRTVYELSCTTCPANYVSTMGLSLLDRGLQHLEALLCSDMDYPMS